MGVTPGGSSCEQAEEGGGAAVPGCTGREEERFAVLGTGCSYTRVVSAFLWSAVRTKENVRTNTGVFPSPLENLVTYTNVKRRQYMSLSEK